MCFMAPSKKKKIKKLKPVHETRAVQREMLPKICNAESTVYSNNPELLRKNGKQLCLSL